MSRHGMPLPDELVDAVDARRKALVVGEAGTAARPRGPPAPGGRARGPAGRPGFAAGLGAARLSPDVVVLVDPPADGGETLAGLRCDVALASVPVVAAARAEHAQAAPGRRAATWCWPRRSPTARSPRRRRRRSPPPRRRRAAARSASPGHPLHFPVGRPRAVRRAPCPASSSSRRWSRSPQRRRAGAPPAAAPPASARAYAAYLRGRQAEQQSDWRAALEAYRAAVEADPRAPSLRVALAEARARTGDLPGPRRRPARRSTSTRRPRGRRGLAHPRAGPPPSTRRTADAEKALRSAIEVQSALAAKRPAGQSPLDPDPWRLLAQVRLDAGDVPGARRCSRTWRRASRRRAAAALRDLGRVLADQRDLDRAAALYRKARGRFERRDTEAWRPARRAGGVAAPLRRGPHAPGRGWSARTPTTPRGCWRWGGSRCAPGTPTAPGPSSTRPSTWRRRGRGPRPGGLRLARRPPPGRGARGGRRRAPQHARPPPPLRPGAGAAGGAALGRGGRVLRRRGLGRPRAGPRRRRGPGLRAGAGGQGPPRRSPLLDAALAGAPRGRAPRHGPRLRPRARRAGRGGGRLPPQAARPQPRSERLLFALGVAQERAGDRAGAIATMREILEVGARRTPRP